MAEPCIFCQAQATLTGEHLWSNWTNRLFDLSAYTVRTIEPDEHGVPGLSTQWRSKSVNIKFRVVCKKCNNTWMSDLEGRVKNIIKDMIVDAAHVSLSPTEIATIAAFAFKTAVIYDYANLSGEKRPFRGTFFSPRTRQDFRQSLRVPEGVHIWLAKFVSKAMHAGRLRGGYFKFKRGPWKDFHFFVTTYAVGHFAFQILCPRFRGSQHHKIRPPRVVQHPKWNRASVLMWPNDGLAINWPPPQHFTDDSIDTFANRWEVT